MIYYPDQKFIVSSYDYLYLDCGTGSFLGTNSWCEPYKTWKRIYSLKLPENDKILGAVACLWSELVDDETLDGKLWPRVSSLGEVLWSGQQQETVAQVARRLVA